MSKMEHKLGNAAQNSPNAYSWQKEEKKILHALSASAFWNVQVEVWPH